MHFDPVNSDRSMLATLLAATTLASSPSTPPATGNVMVIVLDDVGCDLVGAYENHYASLGKPPGSPAATPAIDQLLAARGIMFTNAWSAPMCTPSRSRILTGRYGFRTGIGTVTKEGDLGHLRNPGLQEDITLLPQLLHLAPTPYMCVALGKWHLADKGQTVTDLRHPLGNPIGTWFDRYAGALFNLSQPVGGGVLNVYSSWEKTYASYIDIGVNPCGPGVPPCNVPMITPPNLRYASVDTADDAIRMVQTLPEPWFLYVSFNGVHLPEHVVPTGLPRDSCGNYSGPTVPCNPGANPTVPDLVRCTLAEVDAQVGRILCQVNEANTTVMLWGDNGTVPDAVLPPNNPVHGKGTVYEDGVHVPFIVRSPYQAASTVGSINDRLVVSTDTFATVAELAGVPASLMTAEDSISLVPYINGNTAPLRRTIFAEGFSPNFVPDPVTGWTPPNYVSSRHNQALRERRYKLIRRYQRAHSGNAITVNEEFYDLLGGGPPDVVTGAPTRDWFETNNLLAQPQLDHRAARILQLLRGQLDAHYPSVVE